jgi:hypothetical protein
LERTVLKLPCFAVPAFVIPYAEPNGYFYLCLLHRQPAKLLLWGIAEIFGDNLLSFRVVLIAAARENEKSSKKVNH